MAGLVMLRRRVVPFLKRQEWAGHVAGRPTRVHRAMLPRRRAAARPSTTFVARLRNLSLVLEPPSIYIVGPQAFRMAIWTGDGGSARSNSMLGMSGGCAMNLGSVPWCGWAAWTTKGWQRKTVPAWPVASATKTWIRIEIGNDTGAFHIGGHRGADTAAHSRGHGNVSPSVKRPRRHRRKAGFAAWTG